MALQKRTLNFLLTAAAIIFLCACTAYADDKVDIHGFISQGYLKTDHNNYMAETKDGSFQFNELGLNFATDLSDKLRIGLQFFARDLGEDGNDDLVLDWAFADYKWRDFLGFRVGRIKTPFGYYNAIRDFDMLRTSIFAPQSVYPEMLRDAFSFMKGVSFYGYVSMGTWGSISYNYLAGLPNVSKDTGYRGATEDFWLFYNLQVKEMTVDLSHAFDCQWETPLPGVLIGGTFYVINNLYAEGTVGGDGGYADYKKLTYFKKFNDMTGYALFLRYTMGSAIFSNEFWENKTETIIDAVRTYDDPGFLKAVDLTNQGWYVSLSYRFNEIFEAEYCYSEFFPDKTNKNGKGFYPANDLGEVLGLNGVKKQLINEFEAWKKTSTFSFRFDINEFWLFKLETAYNDGFGDYTSADNGDHKNLKRYWWLYAAKVTYNF
ncbi:MAG: porin [Proteobacteria bacterium]|nr:porin [Pseudomonadota bacterium]